MDEVADGPYAVGELNQPHHERNSDSDAQARRDTDPGKNDILQQQELELVRRLAAEHY